MNKVFYLIALILIISTTVSGQQFYKKEIADVKTDLLKSMATSEGGFFIYNTFPEDTILFQLIKYDTCGMIEWSNIYSDTLADSTAKPLIVIDDSDNARILYLDHSSDSTDIRLFQPDNMGAITSQNSIATDQNVEHLDNLVFDEIYGLFVTAHTINSKKHVTFLFNIDLNNTLSWVQNSEDQYHGITIFEDTLITSSFPDEMDSTVHIESINVNGSHQWNREFKNLKSVSNIVEIQEKYVGVGQFYEGVTDTANHALFKMDLSGDILLTSELFPSNGNGILLNNERGLLFTHYDSLYKENAGTENLSFIQFNANGDINQQFHFEDINDTLDHGPITACILSDNVAMAVANYGSSDSTTNFLYLGKISAPGFQFGMGCKTEPYEQKDTAIMIKNDSVGLSSFNDLSWTITPEENTTSSVVLVEDETICQIMPMSSEAPSPQCIGEKIDYFDPRTGKTIVISSDTIVIQDQFMFCGSLITQSVKFTFSPLQSTLPIPKAFTPNNDRMNDDFGVLKDTMTTLQLTSFEMRIFNRWGEKVFESDNIDNTWDGNHKSKQAIPGVYIYYIAYKGKLGTCDIDEVIKGDVTLIR